MEQPFDLLDEDFHKDQFGYLQGMTYLDHAGAALYPRGIVAAAAEDLCNTMYSNPHSSMDTVNAINNIRHRILKFFNTDAEHYSVIFTSGATEAIKIVADTFNFRGNAPDLPGAFRDGNSSGSLMYLLQNHTSVIGMRNVMNVTQNNVPVTGLDSGFVRQCATEGYNTQTQETFDVLSRQESGEGEGEEVRSTCRGNSLFVFPAQCNFSGYKYPLQWIDQVQKGVLEMNSKRPSRWFCFLDAAAFVSTSELNLTSVQPDFICISFYKIFGLPTGLGALIVRNRSAFVLRKQYFGGGTVNIALPGTEVHYPKTTLHERFEDGTINFHAIIAVGHGLDWLERIGLTMPIITNHCHRLAQYMYQKLSDIRHHNMIPAVVIYAETRYEDSSSQGPIISFNLLNNNGNVIGFNMMKTLAEVVGISLRVGCFCNPGACQRHLRLTNEEYLRFYTHAGHVCGDSVDMVEGVPTGCVRISFGLYTRQRDLDILINTISGFVRSLPPPALPLYQNEVSDVPMDRNRRQHFEDDLLQDEPEMPQLNPNMRLTHITIYPIKSCRGMAVNSWTLGNRGLLYDRYWMVVDASGVAYTLKRDANMCRIQPIVDMEQGLLMIYSEGYPPCSVPLNMQERMQLATTTMCRGRVCGHEVNSIDCGDEVSTWINRVLGKTGLRLVQQNDEAPRMVMTGGASSSVALSNQAQFLMINENSVTYLMDKLPNPSEYSKNNVIRRFRTNFVFAGGCPSFQEELWGNVTIGEADFLVTSVCNRCMVVTLNPTTGEKTPDLFMILNNHCEGKSKFGIYLKALTPFEVVVRVGDRVIPTLK